MILFRRTWECIAAVTVLALVSLVACAGTEGAVPETRKSDLQEKPITVFSIRQRPESYSAQRLADLLFQKLTPDEMSLVRNPLARTPEMNAWARQITTGTTNDMLKAKRLFDELTRRINPPGPGGTRTAAEVFAAWESPETAFCCEEYASIYVALARAVGLPAFFVYVAQQYTGATPRHACAGVFTGGDDLLLVDPTIPWFGVPHQKCIIMDDAQTIASYMVQAPGLKQHRIAYKLAPDLSIVESNFYLSLMSESQWKEARQVLDAMPRWNTEAWVTNLAQGRWALHEGKPEVAATWLQQAIQLNPYVGVCRRMLGDALFIQGKLHEARQTLHESLSYLFDDWNIASVQEAIIQIDELLADRAATAPTTESRGHDAIQQNDRALKIEVEEDQRGANAGDPFAMMLLARRYERGNGVEQDNNQAVKWYRLAEKAGVAEAAKRLEALINRIDAITVHEAH